MESIAAGQAKTVVRAAIAALASVYGGTFLLEAQKEATAVQTAVRAARAAAPKLKAGRRDKCPPSLPSAWKSKPEWRSYLNTKRELMAEMSKFDRSDQSDNAGKAREAFSKHIAQEKDLKKSLRL
jgi:hypothetical protein